MEKWDHSYFPTMIEQSPKGVDTIKFKPIISSLAHKLRNNSNKCAYVNGRVRVQMCVYALFSFSALTNGFTFTTTSETLS